MPGALPFTWAAPGDISPKSEVSKGPYTGRLRGVKSVKQLVQQTSRVALLKSRRSLSGDKELARHSESLKQYTACSPPKLATESHVNLDSSNVASSASVSAGKVRLSTHSAPQPVGLVPPIPITAFLDKSSTVSAPERMGQNLSDIVHRQSLALRANKASSHRATSPSVLPLAQAEKSSDNQGQQPLVRHRSSSVQVPVPRRRSSLTVINLDISHFGATEASLRHRASTLTSTFRQKSGPQSGLEVPDQALVRKALSPPLHSSVSVNGRSSTSRRSSSVSPVPLQIYFPKTFPNGPITTPKPPLGPVHRSCYTGHRRMPRSTNKVYPVPCMTCGIVEGDVYWKCVWCCLRLCGDCMFEFNSRKRDLSSFMDWLEQANGTLNGGEKALEKEHKSLVAMYARAKARDLLERNKTATTV